MASGTLTADYPGRPYYLRLRWWTVENNIGGNYSRYGWDLAAVSKQGWGSYVYDCGNWYVHIGGYNWSGCSNLVFGSGDYTGREIFMGGGETGGVGHDGNGYLNFQVSASHFAPGPFGTADIGWHWTSADRLPKVPNTPNAPTVSEVTVNSMRLNWTIPADNGAGIDQMLLRRWDSADLGGSYVDYVNAGNDTSDGVSGLTPGSRYWWAVYAHNGVGYSPRSGVTSATTIPGTAPGITITPNVAGTNVTVTLAPPGGVTTVTAYNIEYKPVGGSATTEGSGDTTEILSGLIPGNAYEYRANAEIGAYTSPWSDWITVTQPKPNTNAGEFFSGSTPDTADTNYEWAGVAENSISYATLNVITGWMTFGQGNDDSGGTGVVGQVASSLAGGFRGDRLAKVLFHSDATAAGYIGGVGVGGGGDVEPGSTYVGSIYVRIPTRSQRMQGGVAWYNASDTLIDIDWGDEHVIAASANSWTRVTASGVAPAGAEKGAPVVRDVAGTSWAAWEGGDFFYLDAAMLTLNGLFPYFDGSYAGNPIYDTLEFDYAWTGDPNASQSVRYTIEGAFKADPLADPDCASVPAPPMPPVIPSDCIEEVGVWRRYIVQVPESEVRLWSATLPSLVLTTGSVAERQVRIRYFPNPDGLPPETVPTYDWIAEQILTYIPPSTVITLDGVTQRVRAEVGGALPISANHLLYGTNGTPASWPELRCGVGYIITLDVPTDAPSGNLDTQVLLTQRV